MKTQLFCFLVSSEVLLTLSLLLLLLLLLLLSLVLSRFSSLALSRSHALALLLSRSLTLSRSQSLALSLSLTLSLSLPFSDTIHFMQQHMLTQEVSSINMPCHIMSSLVIVTMFKCVFCNRYCVCHLPWAADGRELLQTLKSDIEVVIHKHLK